MAGDFLTCGNSFVSFLATTRSWQHNYIKRIVSIALGKVGHKLLLKETRIFLGGLLSLKRLRKGVKVDYTNLNYTVICVIDCRIE